MKHLLRFLATAVLVSVSLIQQATAADDRKNILGVWRGGMPGEPSGSIELTITPTTITGRNPRTGESLGEGSYQLTPTTHSIDVVQTPKFGRGKTYVGLYSLEGNTLRWCSNSRSKNRPKDLVHRPESDQFLMILERQK